MNSTESFREEDRELREALEIRAKRIAPQADVVCMPGNCDDQVDEICKAIPKPSASNKVLCLCLVDPFDFGIKFNTIQRLSKFFTDFVVLLAIGMDANDGSSPKIDEALGNLAWRQRWKDLGARRTEFRQFLASEFSKSMESLGYLHQELDQMKLVRSDDKNLPLYYLAMFSRHKTAGDFWKDVLKYGTDQSSFSWK